MKKWIISYIAVLYVPILIIGYFALINDMEHYTQKIFENEIKKIDQIKKDFDERFNELKKYADMFSIDSKVSKLTVARYPDSPSIDIFDMFDVNKEIANYVVLNEDIDDIAVAFPKIDCVINSKGQWSFDEFFHMNDSIYKNEKGTILPLISRFNYFKILKPVESDNTRDGKIIVTIVHSMDYSTTEPRSTMIISLNLGYLKKRIGESLDNKYERLSVLDGSGDCILEYSQGSFKEENIKKPDIKTDEGSTSGMQKRRNGFTYTITSDMTGWKYIFDYSGGKGYYTLIKIISYFLIYMLISCIIGILLSIVFAVKNFNPLNSIFKKVKDANLINEDKKITEISYIGESFDRLITEKNYFEDKNKEYEVTLKKNNLKIILHGYFEKDASAVEKLLKDAGVYCAEGGIYGIILTEIKGTIETGKDTGDKTAPYEIVETIYVFEMELGKRNLIYQVVEAKTNRIAAIINFNHSNKLKAEREIEYITSNIKSIIKDCLKNSSNLTLCGVSGDIIGISALYHKAGRIFSKTMINEEINSMSIEDYNGNDSNFYFYPAEWEMKVINSLKSGNADSVRNIIREIRHQNTEKRNLSSRTAKRLLTEIIETEMKVIDEFKLDSIKEAEKYEEVIASASETEIWEYIVNISGNICARIIEMQNRYDALLIKKIYDYANINYGKYSISLSELADELKMSVSYTSKVFKEITGHNFLDYINILRVKEAKRFILDTEDPMYDIARKVGFENYNTFRRVFNKYAGMPPSDYRNGVNNNV